MKVTSKSYDALSQEVINGLLDELNPYAQHLQEIKNKNDWEELESSILLPFDETETQKVTLVLSKIDTTNLKHHIVVGIGGSYFGPKAIYDALGGMFDLTTPNALPKTIFVDTSDPTLLQNLHVLLEGYRKNPNEVLITVISKSGKTTETIVNLEILLSSFPFLHKRLLVVTGEGSKLSKMSFDKNIPVLTIPSYVGGRYSVLSAVGLLPLQVAGIDTGSLLKGARDQVEALFKNQLDENDAFKSAAVIFHHLSNGHNIHNTFLFHPELETLGKWYRQLMGESLGKLHDVDGKEVHVGMTPTVAIGSTDLHSVVQLYLAGPKDTVTTFVSSKKEDNKISVPWDLFFPNLVENIEGKSASTIMHAILSGTQKAYEGQSLPYVDVVLEEINEYELGSFMQFKMLEMMFLARLLNVNAFDQPQVELYKKETREILSTL